MVLLACQRGNSAGLTPVMNSQENVSRLPSGAVGMKELI